ncbi:MAG: BMP family ABC transporter substrate-binding protein [Lachnospiraceae bacterium]|nr:BMP family ABC transporter substrate-binding protein [Lachnospiraceae bacterium]
MKKINAVSIIVCVIAFVAALISVSVMAVREGGNKTIKVGFVYDGDESAPYTYNFIRAQKAVADEYDNRVHIIVKNNITDEYCEEALQQLVDAGCDLIFTTSYGYGEYAKKFAIDHPEIQFCEATCDNANQAPLCPNYHTFMGEIYSGRYISGLAAGMKLKELIDTGRISADMAKIGYVAAYPYAEVISGYTAFLLGVRQIVPDAVMSVIYTNTWGDYSLEKSTAERLISEGCIVISQHSDTIGPAVACENAKVTHPVIHVGYNDSMVDVAPTTSLISSRINWTPYIVAAVGAVLQDKMIEKCVDANVYGNDCAAGFDRDWVQMVELNSYIAADGTDEMIEKTIEEFKKGKVMVFKGDHTGVDPFDPADTIDLKRGYVENERSSAPTFHWVLNDIITIEE